MQNQPTPEQSDHLKSVNEKTRRTKQLQLSYSVDSVPSSGPMPEDENAESEASENRILPPKRSMPPMCSVLSSSLDVQPQL